MGDAWCMALTAPWAAVVVTFDVMHAPRYYGSRRKLRQVEIAGRLDDLRVPPGNRLETLSGDRAGQMSIRINDQYRVCFVWTVAGPAGVEIVDYHG
jgi:proteic killer suppression protein